MDTMQESELNSQPSTTSSFKLHTLRSLPFRLFLECLIDNDLSVLYVSGDAPTDEDLLAYWKTLHLEFVDAISATENQQKLNAEGQYYYYQIQIARIQQLIDAAKAGYQPNILALLKEDFPDQAFSEESYIDDLNISVGLSRRFVHLRNQYELQLKEAASEGGNGSLSYDYFATVLNSISDMVKRDISDEISTLRFTKYYVQLINHIERQELNQNR